jgi:3-phenylpropionate/trans-cinnamate dioxygenase ferredoxin reductase component
LKRKLVIIGGGQAAFALAAKLRLLQDTRPIVIVSAEQCLPYQRPPLSKKYLLGEMSLDRLMFRAEDWYSEHDVQIHLGVRAEALDRNAKTVSLSDGQVLSYDDLALATGSTPRTLPAAVGGDLENVLTVRDYKDADRLATLMTAGKKLLIIGGGYIGLEAASVARKLGVDVTLIEMAERILNRVASRDTADIMRGIHKAHGVHILENTGLQTLMGTDGRVTGAILSDGTTLDVDFVIAGIGASANDQLAQAAGIDTANGIVVDAFGRTSDPDIYAMGDCALLEWEGTRVRLESVQNAVDQAEAVAAILAGGTAPYAPKPWFWSDQYDVKLQIAGFNLGYTQTVQRAGNREGSASVWYFRKDRLIAVDAINDAKAYVTGKKLLETGKNPDLAALSDPDLDLKSLL